MDPDETRFRRRASTVVGLVLAVALVAALVVAAAEVLLVLFAGVLVAVFLRALALPLAKRLHIAPKWCVGLIALVLAAVTGLTVVLAGPSIAEQGRALRDAAPSAIDDARAALARSPWGARILEVVNGELGQGGDDGGANGGALFARAASFLAVTFQAIAYGVIIVISGLYFAVAPEPYIEGAVRLCPPRHRDRARHVLAELGKTLRWFLVGRAVSMVAVGVLTTIGLMLIGVPFAGVLGIVAGALTFVPYAGPLAASVPIALVALAEGTGTFVGAMLFYAGVQSIEGFVITPVAQERVIKLLPVVTLAAEALMGWLYGPLGILVSVPLAAAVMVLVREVYVEGVLERAGSSRPLTFQSGATRA
jgi:predicted PurR-regulated permease PerM